MSRSAKLHPTAYHRHTMESPRQSWTGIPAADRTSDPRATLDDRAYARLFVAVLWLLLGITASANAIPSF